MSESPHPGHNPGQNAGPSSGLDELVQRIRAFSEPVTDSRVDSRPDSRPDLRPPYRGAPLPIGPASNGARYEAYEDVRMSPPPIQAASVPQSPLQQTSQNPGNGSYRSQYPPSELSNPQSSYPSVSYTPKPPAHQPLAPEPFAGFNAAGNGNGSKTNGRYAPQSPISASQTTYSSGPQRSYAPEPVSSEHATSERFAQEKYIPDHRSPDHRSPDYRNAVHRHPDPRDQGRNSSDRSTSDRSVSESMGLEDFGGGGLGAFGGSEAFGETPGASSTATAPQFGQSNPPTGSPSGLGPNAAVSSTIPVQPLDPNSPFAGFQRAINAVRSTLPLVQRLLPLLDGNLTTAINALVAQQPSSIPGPSPQQVRVDLAPIERGLSEVRNNQRELRTQVLEQITTFKRVEDQLERVREATDRNTLEQQELVEDLRSVGNRVSTFAIVGVVLLVLLLGINIFFLVQLQHILR